MASESEWRYRSDHDHLQREKTLKSISTRDITADPVHRAPTAVIKATIKSPDEVVEELKTWLRTGVAPDGTRMMTEESWQWHQDYYQGTARTDPQHECLPEGSNVDYYYWTAPFLAHIGPMSLVMMHAQVNVEDGTHLPADRLRAETALMKNVRLKAQKRAEVEQRQRQDILSKALEKKAPIQLERIVEPGHPLYDVPIGPDA